MRVPVGGGDGFGGGGGGGDGGGGDGLAQKARMVGAMDMEQKRWALRFLTAQAAS